MTVLLLSAELRSHILQSFPERHPNKPPELCPFSPWNSPAVSVSVVSLVADVSNDEDEYDHDQVSSDPIIEETSATLRARTQVIAQHLANFLQQSDPLAKTIVFCVDQVHAEKMREALEQVCSEFVIRYHGYIERIVSDEGTDGKRALGRFGTPAERTPVIVTTSRLLSTGVDVPTCQNIVLARPVGSLVEFKQIIGRGSRLYEPDKTWFTIIDYAGAIKLFFDPCAGYLDHPFTKSVVVGRTISLCNPTSWSVFSTQKTIKGTDSRPLQASMKEPHR